MSAAQPGDPTVVLVHGAFADASSWTNVIGALRDAEIAVQAPPNPLRGLTLDGEYIANLVGQIAGPVVLVGHSYGGAVITYASAKATNVAALVFVASFGVDRGVSALGSVEGFPPTELATALRSSPYTDGERSGTELYIQPDRFPSVFAGDLPLRDAAVLALRQRPVTDVALGEPLAVEPGWRRLPSWFIVAGADHAIDPGSERAAGERMDATLVEIEAGSHAIALSHPERVAGVIADAVAVVRDTASVPAG